MQQVEVNAIGLQFGKLFVENPLAILLIGDAPGGELRGQLDPLPVPIGQGLAHHDLTVAAVVDVGRIQIVHAVVDGIANHFDRLDLRPLPTPHPCVAVAWRQSRVPKPERLSCPTCGIS